jgi:hypothetical protein
VALLALGFPPAIADAYVPEPVVQENIPAIADHLARGGAVPIPGVDCGARCADWWVQEHRPIPNQPSSDQLHRELRRLRWRTKLLPPPSALGSIALRASAITGTFTIGWTIGTGVRKYLKIGVPEPELSEPGKNPTLRWSWFNRTVAGGDPPLLEPELVLPAGTFHLQFVHKSSVRFDWRDFGGEGCDIPLSVPAELRLLSRGIRCNGPWGSRIGTQYAAYLPEDELGVYPVEDYVDQPTDVQIQNWDGKPGTRTQLEQSVQTELSAAGSETADAWWSHLLDPQTYDDPTEDKDEATDCRPTDSVPAGDPAPERGTQNFLDDPVRWRARYETVPESQFPPGSTVPEDGLIAANPSGARAYMRWGWAALDAEKPLVDWEGWGFRKIVAKHGWSTSALEKTAQALLMTPTTDDNYEEYVGPPYASRRGVPTACEWVVVVQREPYDLPGRPEAQEGAPMDGIITAHGRYVRPI